MKTVQRRLNRLEDRLRPRSQEQMIGILQQAGRELALDNDRCIEILREAGWLDPASACSLVNLCNIPDGLNAAELERHLREHGDSRRSD